MKLDEMWNNAVEICNIVQYDWLEYLSLYIYIIYPTSQLCNHAAEICVTRNDLQMIFNITFNNFKSKDGSRLQKFANTHSTEKSAV